MQNIRPITDLRKTSEIDDLCHSYDGPIFITKNGYSNLVIMSSEYYEKIAINTPIRNSNNIHNITLNEQTINDVNPLNHYFIKCGCATNKVKVGDATYNANEIIKIINEKCQNDLDILVFPELSLTGYTCQDMFFQNSLLNKVTDAIVTIAEATKSIDTLIFIGAPLSLNDKLYNCAIAINKGKILGVTPKTYLPNYNEFYENRHFNSFESENTLVRIKDKFYPFGTKLIYVNANQTTLKVACELCEDVWSVNTPSTNHVLAGANIIANLSASNEYSGKHQTRKTLIKAASYRLVCGYLYASSGNGESSQDLVFSSHNLICENGHVLKESELFKNEYIESEIDIERLSSLRRKNTSFKPTFNSYSYIFFEKAIKEKKLQRIIRQNPFIIDSTDYNEIITMQALGLIKRMETINCFNTVLGLSGGLDSTLALLAIIKAYDILGISHKKIHTLSMPCFATTKKTRNNASLLAKLFDTNFIEIDITKTVKSHLNDLNHPDDLYDVTFENAQARERTQVLFDYANSINGLVIGTGDLSEIALGFATYNGDQMSSYSLNSSIPKTLVKFIVSEYGKHHEKFYEILKDILETPISPELVPSKDGDIIQVTEDIIGPYELHDFFLYYLMSFNFSTKKIYYLAKNAFKGKYDDKTIAKYLKLFIKRFFNNQFKRSAMPDGVKVTEISLSPRGDLRWPSDASSNDFIDFE